MPNFDGRGPSGEGPMAGGVTGFCGGGGGRGGRNRSEGGGFAGRGGGCRGCKNGFSGAGRSGSGFSRGPQRSDQGLAPDFESPNDLETLKAGAGYFEKILGMIRRQIQWLESGT